MSTGSNAEVDGMKAETFAAIKGRSVIMLIDGVEVREWTPDSVFPVATYPSKRAAASRILQLLEIGPVAPQTHPEDVCIGTVQSTS